MSIGGRSQRGNRTFEAIVAAAEPQFLQSGFHGTRIDDVASAARVSVGTVYLHFQNKDGVYAAVILRAQDVLLGQYLDPVFDLETPPWDRIQEWCRAYLRFFEEHEARARLLAMTVFGDVTAAPPTLDTAMRDRVARSHERFVALFAEARDAGDIGDADPLAASRFVWGSVYGICLLNIRHGDLRLDSAALRQALAAGLTLMDSEKPGAGRFGRGGKRRNQIDA